MSALRALEDDGDVDAMADVGTDQTRWWGVGGHSELRGSDAARHFWDRYRRSFAATQAAPDAGGGTAQDDGMLDDETAAAGHNSGLAT